MESTIYERFASAFSKQDKQYNHHSSTKGVTIIANFNYENIGLRSGQIYNGKDFALVA